MNAFLVVVLLGAVLPLASFANTEDSLVLLHVVFRHGERTPDASRYPNDPYLNEEYYPYGSGQLTNEGKRTEYGIGKALRRRYGQFLGSTFTPDVLDARSTDTNRTKMSLQLALASLYPPIGTQIWNLGQLFWQPIPYNYVPISEDSVMYGMACPNFFTFLSEYFETEEYAQKYAAYADLVAYVNNFAGTAYTNTFGLFAMYFTLATEQEWGFELPEWTNSVFPDALYDVASHTYIDFTANTNLKRIMGGGIIQKIAADTQAKINGELEGRKVFLYSGHEMNVGTVLSVLDVFDPQVPAYGSYITFEVHNIENEYSIRVLFQNYTNSDPYVMPLPGCGEYCPVDQFVQLYEEYFPDEESCGR